MGIFSTWRHTKALRELTERVESLERSFKAIEAEWDDTYDRIRKTMQRVVKRAEVAEKLEAKQSAGEGHRNGAGAGADLGGDQMHAGLTEHQRQVQQDILRKRARL